jgi:hypothetical protein
VATVLLKKMTRRKSLNTINRQQKIKLLFAKRSCSSYRRQPQTGCSTSMLKSKRPETSSSVLWLSKFLGLLWFGQKCPLCTSILFTEAEHQSLDRLFRLLAFRPVRCANCFRRYYCFAKA